MKPLGQFLSVLFLVGVVVHYFWWLSGVVVVFGLVRRVRRLDARVLTIRPVIR
jgi:hypothetical protein